MRLHWECQWILAVLLISGLRITVNAEEQSTGEHSPLTADVNVVNVYGDDPTASLFETLNRTLPSGLGSNGARRRRKRSREFTLRVMTFNTWLAGAMVDRGLDKIAKHILANRPDIVFLQEIDHTHIPTLLPKLTDGIWTSCSLNVGRMNHVITRHQVAFDHSPAPTFMNNGCQIRYYPPNHDFSINVFNVHLYSHRYAPYKACSRSSPMRSGTDLWDCEANPSDKARSRISNIGSLAAHAPFDQALRDSSTIPVILAGDFNAPSHLDWIDRSRHLHCDCTYEWPVSKFVERLGLIDTYRAIRPDPVRDPGSTWSTVYKRSTDEFVDGRPMAEPQDRIDYVFYKGDKLRVTDSYVYSGTESIREYPDYRYNDWPSDHASVVTTFVWSEVPAVIRHRK